MATNEKDVYSYQQLSKRFNDELLTIFIYQVKKTNSFGNPDSCTGKEYRFSHGG